MELIEVSGYILDEKTEIAKRHLWPNQLENHGIAKSKVSLSKKVMAFVIENYTRESGVRELNKVLAKLARKYALKIATNKEFKKTISVDDIKENLGVQRFSKEKWQDTHVPGVVTGLAWTAVGGEILYIESSLSKGNGKLTLTGNLGDVMKESAVLALEYIKSNCKVFGIEAKMFEENNIHVHVPEGAIPKDGPSAGITMATALVSSFSGKKVKKRIAMTGEITLRGKVLPVGGIKEKILAAKRAGIKEIILSKDNMKDVGEIKDVYVEGLEFHYVNSIKEVLDVAIV
ncbi:S16 family serine protease [Saccharicrinis fermentans]|uniref:endopeptidase La n=2 Tax=Saccharicrinis fermentans TaxID=982 RepID=W7YB83_9BACT|nr:S16 family serine protease [Saccharicrinis fermentans]GAF01646.1 lon protease 2 [Saccharicrinis fermentans DSM 9555 = JCM 21142]